MAKALYGHVANTDVRLIAEVQRLRRRVRDLEDELARSRARTDAPADSVVVVNAPADYRTDAPRDREPALA